MGYKLIRQEDFNTYTIKHFQCDALTDRATIVSDYSGVTGKNALHAGWTATVTANDSTVSFVLGNDLSSWTEVAFSKGGDPGSGYFPLIASTDSVMTTNGSGDPTTIPYSTEDDADTMMLRDAEGKTQVATPVASDDEKTVANKEYVGLVANEFEDGTRTVEEAVHAQFADIADQIETDREIEDADTACPPTVFGTVGGNAEVQSGLMKFPELRGHTIKWNQLVQNGNFASTDYWDGIGGTFSVANNIGTLTVTDPAKWFQCKMRQSFTPVIGHKYFVFALLRSSSATQCGINFGSGTTIYITPSANTWTILSGVKTPDEVGEGKFQIGYEGLPSLGDTLDAQTVKLVDLTDIYGAGNEPSTVDEFVRDFPMPYYPYNAGTLLSSKSASVDFVKRNQWDEETKIGDIDIDNGNETTGSNLISSNYIEVLPNTTYYWKSPYGGIRYFYGANKEYLGAVYPTANTTFTTPINVHYMKFRLPDAYGTTYNHDICIYVNWDTPGLPYVPYSKQHITLPNIELRSAGSAYDVLYQPGGGKRRIYYQKLSMFDYSSSSQATYMYRAKLAERPKSVLGSVIGNVQCNNFDTVPFNAIYNGAIGVAINTASELFISFGLDSNFDTIQKANAYLANNDVYVQFELETETDITLEENPGWTEYAEIDNFGTVKFNQSPAQDIPVPQAYFVRYTVNLVEFLDSAYVRADGDVENIVVKEDLNGYLEKKTGTSTQPQVYAKGTDGSQQMLDASVNNDALSIVRRTSTKQIRVAATPEGGDDATSKKYVNDNFLAKDTSGSTYGKAYIKNTDGSQGMKNVTANTEGGAIVVRTSAGQVNVPATPTDNTNAASKQYVDGKVPDAPTTDGTYVLKVTVTGGVPTYSWIAE